jgi:hypothetical protein
MLLSVFGNNAQTLPFRLSKGAGTFRLGVVCGNESCWLDQCSVKKKGQAYTIKDKLWKEGEIKLIVCPLTNSNGFIMEVSGERLPEEFKLCWAFGACDGADDSAVTDNSIPVASCFHNVFSIEGNAFTTYYGESMKLRTVHGVSPIGSEIRLSDGHKQASPLALFNSGKKTDAPVISALCPWKPQEKLYFCFYQRGDYNYFMLPGLFGKEHKTRSK